MQPYHQAMSEPSKAISHEELYQQLWKVPISQLAVTLGYSYAELVRICADLVIPRPTSGYWYRLQHGGASEQVPLPPIPEGTQTEIPLGRRLHEQLTSGTANICRRTGKRQERQRLLRTGSRGRFEKSNRVSNRMLPQMRRLRPPLPQGINR